MSKRLVCCLYPKMETQAQACLHWLGNRSALYGSHLEWPLRCYKHMHYATKTASQSTHLGAMYCRRDQNKPAVSVNQHTQLPKVMATCQKYSINTHDSTTRQPQALLRDTQHQHDVLHDQTVISTPVRHSVCKKLTALSNPKTPILIQKCHPYTVNPNSETPGKSKNVYFIVKMG